MHALVTKKQPSALRVQLRMSNAAARARRLGRLLMETRPNFVSSHANKKSRRRRQSPSGWGSASASSAGLWRPRLIGGATRLVDPPVTASSTWDVNKLMVHPAPGLMVKIAAVNRTPARPRRSAGGCRTDQLANGFRLESFRSDSTASTGPFPKQGNCEAQPRRPSSIVFDKETRADVSKAYFTRHRLTSINIARSGQTRSPALQSM